MINLTDEIFDMFDESFHYDHGKLDKLSGVLDEIAKDIRADKVYSIDKHPKREIVEKGLAEVFGFSKMNVTSVDGSGEGPMEINAYTSSAFMDSESEDRDGHVKNIGKIDKMTVYVTRLVFLDNNNPLTGREIMACILHELGHFFIMSESKIKMRKAAALSAILTLDFRLYRWIKGQSDPVNIKKHADEEDDWVNRVRAYSDGMTKAGASIIDKIGGSDVKEPVVKPSDPVSQIKEKITGFVKNIHKQIINIFDSVFEKDSSISLAITNPILKRLHGESASEIKLNQQVEKDSDEFAASFGYGPDNITGIMKMMADPRLKVLAQNIKSTIKIDNMITGQYWADIDRWLEGKEHDSNKNRAKSILEHLRKYADEPGLSKKDKSDIAKQISTMEKIVRVMEGFTRSEIKSLAEAGREAVDKAKRDRV